MSKSYSKIKRIGICSSAHSDNTEFYRERRRMIRAKEKQVIRDTLAHHDVSVFDEVYTPLNIPLKDDWTEPTDGSRAMNAKELDACGGYDGVYTTKDGKVKK